MGKNKTHDKNAIALGLERSISRRDLLHGIGVSTAILATGSYFPGISFADTKQPPSYSPEKDPDYYPPSKTGLRGSHAGSFESAHTHAWTGKTRDNSIDLDEEYDLIVVGAGISGLTAAYAYQQKANDPGVKILVIDNHDDFGGHAKRIEFTHDGKTYMAPGGSVMMETHYFSEQSKALLQDIGVSTERLEPGQVKNFRANAFDLNPSICFDKEKYGKAVTFVGDIQPMNRKNKDGEFALLKFIPDMPISEIAKKELHDFLTSNEDVFEKLTEAERKAAIHSMSYNTFVTQYCGLSQETADLIFTRQTVNILGVGTDYAPLYEAFLFSGLPGLHMLGVQGENLLKEINSKPPIEGHYGPEGNAIITRNLVRELVPTVTEAKTMEELTTARLNYAKLDDSKSKVRIRLNSTVTNIKNLDKNSRVTVSYVRGDKSYRVNAKHCIYAGWHMYLPYLCPEIPARQQQALKANVKMPFISVDVFLRSGKPLLELGSGYCYFPGRVLHSSMAYGRPLGDHKQGLNADEPIILHMIGGVVTPHTGSNPQDQHRQGRHELLSMKFEDYEVEIREQLASLFASTSFNVSEDIIGITVNRWPHGYSRQYNSVIDPDYEEGQRPHEIARKRFGQIAIANSDASYVALCNTAIDEGLRAVDELMS